MSVTESRPRAVNTAFWLLVVGSALLLFGGLMAAFVSYDALRQAAPATVSDDDVHNYARLYRGAGILYSLSAAALAACAARARARDPRFRRAAMALGLTIVVFVGLAAVFAGIGDALALLSLVPIVVGTRVLSRPNVVEDYTGE